MNHVLFSAKRDEKQRLCGSCRPWRGRSYDDQEKHKARCIAAVYTKEGRGHESLPCLQMAEQALVAAKAHQREVQALWNPIHHPFVKNILPK